MNHVHKQYNETLNLTQLQCWREAHVWRYLKGLFCTPLDQLYRKVWILNKDSASYFINFDSKNSSHPLFLIW